MKFELVKALEILKRTPKLLHVLLYDISDVWSLKNEGEGTWSPYDIIGHLIHGEKTDWITRAKIILDNNENAKFVEFDRFAQFENSNGKSLNNLLDEFSALRMDNVEILKSFAIEDEDMILEGIHPEFGTVNLKQLISAWVVHDLGHIAQISRVIAKQYKDEVGSFVNYLGVLK